jgi:prevent-host-death family protein
VQLRPDAFWAVKDVSFPDAPHHIWCHQCLISEQCPDAPHAPAPTGCSPFLSVLQANRHFWLNWLTAEPRVVQVNMLDAKSQLSRLVKAALAGEEVIIASHGKAQVKLVPCASAAGLKQLGALAAASPGLLASQVDAAFAEEVDQQVAELFNR